MENKRTDRSLFRNAWSKLKTTLTRTISRPKRVSARRSEAQEPFWGTPSTVANSVVVPSPIPFETPPRRVTAEDRDHNAKRPINRLPTEILAEIFVLLCDMSKIGDDSWISCSYVCSLWRQIALDMPEIWSHVIFTSTEWTKLCLDRAKSSPLIIRVWMQPENESSVCDILDLTNRIKEIHIAILHPLHRLGEKLFRPFPALEGLRIVNSYGWPVVGDEVPSYPNLRWLSLVQSHPTFSIPIHSTRLNFMEIVYDSFSYPLGWADLSDALQSLPELRVLKLGNFPDPDTVPGHQISLPSVRHLTLQGPTARCTHFIHALESPQISDFCLELWDVADCGTMFRSVMDTLSASPRTMAIDHLRRQHYNGPHMPESDVGLHFSYQDAIQNTAFQWNIHFVWNSRVSDSDLLVIADAVSEIRHLETLESLLIYKCDVVPQGSWLTLLRRLNCVQTLIVGSCPASGMFWDLLKHAEDPRNSPPLLPMLRTIALIGVDFSLGGWMPRGYGTPGNSYSDLDGARFLELLVCYLEMRITKLLELKLFDCIGYTVAELKLLRRLVDEVQWDGCGSIAASYPSHWDLYFGLTINHQLLSSRPGYAECNLPNDKERLLKFCPCSFEAPTLTAGGRW